MPRSFKHLTPRYIWNRSLDKLWRAAHPGLPWLEPRVVQFLSDYLQPSDIGLEFGSGRSTIWFARRIGALTSVEHNPVWIEKVRAKLENETLSNVKLVFAPKEKTDLAGGENSAYVGVTSTIEPQSLDFVLVDGIYRGQCALKALSLLKPHGILIIDNVNHALPSYSKAPNSRSEATGPQNEDWETVWKQIRTWRRFWVSNGVSDTAIFFNQ